MADTDYGLIIYNAAGVVQIDSAFPNPGLIKEDSESCTAQISGYEIDMSLTLNVHMALSEWPIIGIKANASYYNCMHGMSDDGGTNFWDRFRVWTETTHTVYYAAWGLRNYAGSGDYGLIVNNSVGRRVFDSNLQQLTIVSVNTGSAAYGDTDNHTVVDATGNYFILTNPCWDKRADGRRRRGFKSTSSTNIRVSTYLYDATNSSADSDWEDDYTLIELMAPR